MINDILLLIPVRHRDIHDDHVDGPAAHLRVRGRRPPPLLPREVPPLRRRQPRQVRRPRRLPANVEGEKEFPRPRKVA